MAKKAKKSVAQKKAAKKAAKKTVRKTGTRKYRSSPKKDDCFITTACVEYYGLPDDCHQLVTLRFFRDKVLAQSSHGRYLILNYYKIAPRIVACLNSKQDDRLFTKIFEEINKACNEIEKQRYPSALAIYTRVVSSLANHFNVDEQNGSKR